MKYENATDFELNKRMGELLANPEFDFSLVTWKRSEDMHGEDGGAEMWLPAVGGGLYRDRTFHYTSDWNATMPLAVEYGVTPLLDDGFGYATTDPYECYEPHGASEEDGFFAVKIDHDTPPLRAIVICLIKVLEAK